MIGGSSDAASIEYASSSGISFAHFSGFSVFSMLLLSMLEGLGGSMMPAPGE
jgi:hypothetical protein